ncbi:MAG: T9SS type A sorting domain-containing protein, partial [Bacteroidota bacterium]
PECENEEEEIDKVTLTFTPVGGGTPVVAIAEDPDGPGPLSIVPEEINLMESTEYELSIMLENTIEGEDITEEIEEEDEDHIFLFAFGEDVFDTPNGNGNVDERTDPINYNDQDENGLDVGLSTQWTTSCTQDGDIIDTFRVVLKHQPGLKTATSGFDVGGTDINILWDINIIDNPDAPECENEEEEIDKVTLIFSPADGSFPTISEAIDPDGPGPLSIQPLPITLMQNTTYNLSIELENTIEGEDITEEIEEEAEEHQFFFQFTDNIFSDPIEDGNFDDRDDPINYVDFDDNNLPVGLSTTWTTSNASEVGTLRIRLKHQPGIKSDMSTADDGGTDIDLTWDISLVVTSTDNLAANQKVTIAPNPVKDNLILVTENIDLSDAEIMIFNSLGQLMKSVVYTNPSIRISELPSGSYAFIAKKGNLTVTRRFVKMQ